MKIEWNKKKSKHTHFGSLPTGAIFEKLDPEGKRRGTVTLYMKTKKEDYKHVNYAVSLIQGSISTPKLGDKVLHYPDAVLIPGNPDTDQISVWED